MKKKSLLAIASLSVFVVISTILLSSSCANTRSKSNSPLIVEEYKIISQDIDSPFLSGVEFNDRIGSEILKKRKQWRESKTTKDKITQTNEEIRRFGYKFVENEKPSYNFYYKDDLILPALSKIRCFQLNEKGDKFLFVASQFLETGPPYVRGLLFYKGEIWEWDSQEHDYTCPVLVNDILMTVDKLMRKIVETPTHGYYIRQFVIMKGTRTLYSFSARENVVDRTISSFFVWGKDWIVEYQDTVIISGANIGKKKNYSKVFHYRELKGKPFYFFEQNEKIHISYDDEVLPYTYDDVIHNWCC